MIVTCHSCQTRFRVVDEKIGPKGARVRCSRCKAVFSVRLPATSAGAVAAAAPVAPPLAPPASSGAPCPVQAPELADDPFARAAAGTPERTIPDLALEDTERLAPVQPSAEPSVASRSPGLLDFGEVDLAGSDAFGDTRRQAFGDFSRREDGERGPAGPEDPLAGFSLADLGAAPEPPTSALLPPSIDAPPLPAAAPPVQAATTAPQPVPRAPPPDPEQDAAADAERSRKRLRAVGVNALSLVALVVLAVVLFQVWRGRQNAVPVAGGPAAPAVALDVSSGPYDTASGKPVVVVRGRIQATERLRGTEVRVELLDGGRAVAAGSALAGAVPTVEEIHAVASAADAAALGDAIASRAPDEVAAGEVLPFAVVVAEPPSDLSALEVRVSLRPETLGATRAP